MGTENMMMNNPHLAIQRLMLADLLHSSVLKLQTATLWLAPFETYFSHTDAINRDIQIALLPPISIVRRTLYKHIKRFVLGAQHTKSIFMSHILIPAKEFAKDGLLGAYPSGSGDGTADAAKVRTDPLQDTYELHD